MDLDSDYDYDRDVDVDLDVDLEFGFPRRSKTTSTPPDHAFTLQPAPSGFMADKRSLRRTHSQMENEGPPSPSWHRRPEPSAHSSESPHNRNRNHSHSHSHNSPRPSVSGLHLPRIPNMAHPPPHRYPGDGFDYRRPMALTRPPHTPAIIDLTDDSAPSASSSRPPSATRPQRAPQRGPRYGRDIIDIIDLEAEPDDPMAGAAPGSPEVQFIESRRISPAARPVQERHASPGEDDLEITGSNVLARSPPRVMGAVWGRGLRHEDIAIIAVREVFEEHFGGEILNLHRHLQRVASRPPEPAPRNNNGRGRRSFGFVRPDMDYEMAGFDFATGARPAPPPPAATYEAPAPAPEGFTRSPQASGALACPNCDAELCVGETELQRQVWLVKGCGHVYCGQCTAHRFQKKSTKGKEKAIPPPADHRPFKECVVEGCSKKTSSPKSMIQIFL